MVLEGADGCGKSTQAARLVAGLEARGGSALHVRDPGGTQLAEAVRTVLLDRRHDAMSVAAETYLYLAARAQLADEVIAPSLERGETVVCERWTLSTEVYQGLAGGLGAATIRTIGSLAERAARPDLVLLLDVAVGDGLARLSGEPDRIEARGDAFHERVVRGYRELATGRPDHVVVPVGTLDEVAARVLAEVVDRAG